MQDSIFTKGQEYKRSEIHDQYGGSRQSGICPSAKYPFIFIFSSQSGEKYGYSDGWLNNEKTIFSYTGAGQEGDMKFTHGNKALKDHLINRKRVFLFEESQRSYFRFTDELRLEETDSIQANDTFGNIRQAILFRLRVADRAFSIPSDKANSVKEPRRKKYSRPKLMDKTEKEVWAKHRIGQEVFRQNLLIRWEGRCVVSSCEDPRMLTASHIVSWKVSSDTERLDIDNGLLLSPVYDRLFDQHLISFTDTGKIVLSSWVTKENYLKLGVTGNERIIGLNEGNINYLKRHRELSL